MISIFQMHISISQYTYVPMYMMIGREQTIACADDLGIHNKKRQIMTTIRIKIENESKKTGLNVNEQKVEITRIKKQLKQKQVNIGINISLKKWISLSI